LYQELWLVALVQFPVLLFFGGLDLAGCRRRGFSGCPCAEGALADTIIAVPRIGPGPWMIRTKIVSLSRMCGSEISNF
jgi:hypothetical protein